MSFKKNKNLTKPFDFYFFSFLIVLVSGAWWRFQFIFSDHLFPDEGLYCWFGQKIFENPGFILSQDISLWHPPLFSVFLAVGHLFLPSELACRFVSFIFYCLGIWLIYFLGTRLANKFVGLLAAINLTWCMHYILVSSFVLSDVPFLALCVLYAYFLSRINQQSDFRDHLKLGLCGMAVIGLRWPGLLIIPWTFFYYLLALEELSIKERIRRFLIPFSMAVFVVLFFGGNNWIQHGNPLPLHTQLDPIKAINLKNHWISFLKFIKYSVPLFFVFGAAFFFVRIKKSIKILLFLWFLVSVISFLMIAEKLDVRYLLPALPSMILMNAMVIDIIVQKISRSETTRLWVATFFVFFAAGAFFLSKADKYVLSMHQRYFGYREAGEWVREHNLPGTIVLTDAERQLRYYSGINFQKYGGQIVPFLGKKEELEKIIEGTKERIILIVDYWGLQGGYSWTNYMDEAAKEYLESKGFRFVQVVYHQFIKDKSHEIPVMWIFERLGK